MKISRPARILFIMSVVDLVTSVMLFQDRGVVESNPLFQISISAGIGWFAVHKFAMTIVPIALLVFFCEKRARPQFVNTGLWFGVAAYIGLYTYGTVMLHQVVIKQVLRSHGILS